MRTDPRWVELSQSGRGPVRPKGGGWGQAERVRNQIGGVELCRSEPGRNQRSLAEQDQGKLGELRGGAELGRRAERSEVEPIGDRRAWFNQEGRSRDPRGLLDAGHS